MSIVFPLSFLFIYLARAHCAFDTPGSTPRAPTIASFSYLTAS